MKPVRWRSSLRGKLILASALLLLLSSGMLLLSNMHILQQTLSQQAVYQTRQVTALLDQSIAVPLAQRDYAVLQPTLERVVSKESISYIVLFDHRRRQVASAGWDATVPLPPRSTDTVDLDAPDALRHLESAVTLSGQKLGSVWFGVSVQGLRASQTVFERQSAAIAAATLLLSFALVTLLATALTRHLALLEQSSRRIAAGDFDVTVPVVSNDEIGRLAGSFNTMAATLRERLQALRASQTLQKQHLAEAHAGQGRLTALVDAIPSGILFVDGGRILHANGTFGLLWNVPGELTGALITDVLPHLRGLTAESDVAVLEYLLRAPGPDERVVALELHTRDGRLISQQVRRVTQSDGANAYLCIHEDVTLARHTQQRAQQALLDPLTQLPNRRGLFEALAAALGYAGQNRSPLVLMFIDLDNFKQANDIGGHRIGDEILVAVAATLTAQLRPGEIVARLGGDEYAIICPELNVEQAGVLATRLGDAVSKLRFASGKELLQVGCSIGIASYPADARTADDLIACADTAMYQVKQRGKNGWLSYKPDAGNVGSEVLRVDWNGRIQRAFNEQRFLLLYQPVFHARELRVAYHEALLRMTSESDPAYLISPTEFIAHAERSGTLGQIDRWVFEACAAQLAKQPGLTLTANLSAVSLADAGFAHFLRDTLQRHDIDPRRLHIELTGTMPMAPLGTAIEMIGRLRAVGCAIHLDDFGNGFSSFSHLKLADIDTIKIDGGLIRDLESDHESQLLVGAIVSTAHQLNKRVSAKHVENEATIEILRKLGIDQVQGFHLGRPAREIHRHKPKLVTLNGGSSQSSR